MMKKSLFIPILAMLFVAAACTSPDDLADSGNDGKQEKAIKVGDYYNQGLVKGIVFSGYGYEFHKTPSLLLPFYKLCFIII